MSPSEMIGKLHIITLFGPAVVAGSSLATAASGVGENQPAWRGRPGARMSMAWRPAEDHVTSARSRVRVGLCAVYVLTWFVSGVFDGLSQNARVFSYTLYSLFTFGLRGFPTLRTRAHPHGQP